MTFKVGDKVEVIVEGDPMYGSAGVVEETYLASNYRQVGIVLDDGSSLGKGVVLWFGKEELRKVDA
ncbi:hypothetical protein [Streptomyces sp. NPDC006355]|uniref:hypothetical protein n=1 Tax=Streptomyces sp. NPDC006355 TaxID=3156758 RepID=UPI0033BDDF0E